MTKRRIVRKIVKKLTGAHVVWHFPHGVKLFLDIKERLPNWKADVLFDVGANVGQVAKKFLKRFPSSQIYCFEPVTSTFSQLQTNLAAFNNVYCAKIALGDQRSKGTICVQQRPTLSFIVEGHEQFSIGHDENFESVEIETLSEFCQSKKIAAISLLKIDTEGYDLRVLMGAEDMLRKQTIDLIWVEAGMNPRNRTHIPFEKIKQYLESMGYLLFGIYEQVPERPTWEPHMRRSNLVFISEIVITENRKVKKDQRRDSARQARSEGRGRSSCYGKS